MTDYEIIERNVAYQGYFRVIKYLLRHRLFDGKWSKIVEREVFERPSAAGILLYDPKLDKVVLIEQFRPGTLSHTQDHWLIEIVAGILGKDETPADVAIREAMEEANCKVLELMPICDYFVSPGGCNEYIHIYLGKVDASNAGGIFGLAEEQEDIRVVAMPAQEAFQLVKKNKIRTAPAIIALQWLELNLEKIR